MPSRGQVYQRHDRPGFYARFKLDGRYVNKGGFLSEDDAAAWIHQERSRLQKEEILGITPLRGEVTFGRFFPKWKEWAESRWTRGTFLSSLATVEGVLLPELKDKPLGKITTEDLEDVLEGVGVRRAIVGATRNRYICLLSTIFKLAVRKKLARSNPARGVERGKEKVRALAYLGPEEEARLFAALPAWLRVPALTALDTGLRAGEVGGLTRRDIDLGRGVLTVRLSKNRTPRQVGLTARLRAALEAHLKALPRGQERLFLRPTDGKPFSSQIYRSDWVTAVERAGLGGGEAGGCFRYHDLRHMAGVRLAEAGATPGEIKAILGHKSLAATMRYLDHSPRGAGLNAGRLLDARREAASAGGRGGSVEGPQDGDDHGVVSGDDQGLAPVDDHGRKKGPQAVDDHCQDRVICGQPSGDRRTA